MVSMGAQFFELDDDFSKEDEDQQQLSWRGDPTTTHSDWTIVIGTENDDGDSLESNKYHVHKAILGVGPRSSAYFATLFGTIAEVKEKQGSTSHINLERGDAQVFPIVLDYMYTGQLEASTQNAVALRSLARYFHCRELMRTVSAFIQNDLKLETAPTYLLHAWERNDEKLLEASRKLITTHFDKLNDRALEILPTELFRTILGENKREDNHAFLSRVIYYFFEYHPEARNATLLSELTSHLTRIDVSVVGGFLQLVAQLDPHDNEKSWFALDSLCKGCAATLVTDWKHFDTELCIHKFLHPSQEGDFRGTGRIAVRLMGAGIEQAKADYKVMSNNMYQEKLENLRLSKQVSEQQERIAELQQNLRQMTENSQLKNLEILGLTIGLNRQKRKTVEMEDQIAKLQEQIAELQEQFLKQKVSLPKKRGGWS
jgi:uncharacterized small protein (DUF1192 family)